MTVGSPEEPAWGTGPVTSWGVGAELQWEKRNPVGRYGAPTPGATRPVPDNYYPHGEWAAVNNPQPGTDQWLSSILTQAAPLQAQYGILNDSLLTMNGFQNQLAALDRQDAMSAHGLAMDRLGLKQQGIGNDQENLAAKLGFVDRRQGLADRSLTNEIAKLAENADTAHRNLTSDFVSRGTIFAPFHALGHEDIDQALAMGTESQNIGRDQAQVGFDEARSDINTQQKNLQLTAAGLGVDARELQSGLDSALQKMGIQDQIRAEELFSAQQNLDLEQTQALTTILNEALLMAGYAP